MSWMQASMAAAQTTRSTGEATLLQTQVSACPACIGFCNFVKTFVYIGQSPITSYVAGHAEHHLPSAALYELLYHLSSITGQAQYASAADAALSFFLGSCLVPANGLLPWGAHAQWDFWTDSWARGAWTAPSSAGPGRRPGFATGHSIHSTVPHPEVCGSLSHRIHQEGLKGFVQSCLEIGNAESASSGLPAGLASYKGRRCCPQDYQVHQLVAVPDSLWAKLWALNATAMEIYVKVLPAANSMITNSKRRCNRAMLSKSATSAPFQSVHGARAQQLSSSVYLVSGATMLDVHGNGSNHAVLFAEYRAGLRGEHRQPISHGL